jgi:serine/threonine-protein kinase TTK/MPS1
MWQQMPEAARTVHEAKVVRDDLKPANFMFVAGMVKLIDFWISMSIWPDKSTTSIEGSRRVGTINRMSLESLEAQPARQNEQKKIKLGRHAGVWALATVSAQSPSWRASTSTL